MQLSLRKKFLIPTLFLIIAGMGLSSVISYVKSKRTIEAAISQQIVQLTESTVASMASWMKDRHLDMSNWAQQKIFQTALQDDFMGKAARKGAQAQLSKMKEDYGYYQNICLLGPQGEVVAAADDAALDKLDLSKQPNFLAAIAGKASVSDPLKHPGTKKPVFVIAFPVADKETVKGVLLSMVDLEHFNRLFIDPVKVGKSGYAFLFNKEGMVLAHPDKAKILEFDFKQTDFGKEMLEKAEGIAAYRFEGIEKLGAYKRFDPLGWTLVVSADHMEILSPVKEVGFVNLVVVAAVAVVAAFLILLLVSSTIKPIHRIIRELTSAADEVASGAGQVSSASQQLAEGSSEHAASIEETSSSLEEMSSMTKQNADHAGEAKNMMAEVAKIVKKVNDQMGNMGQAIEKITRSSEETGKIIKTIDEISFQTNLLALNAAVEAARAGEAGAGFAVVADEVRNLAMRAAQAAKDTSQLIENTIQAVKGGRELTGLTRESFQENMEIGAKVGDLVEEIAAASHEQAQGIEQVNRAVSDMDGVVQRVAAAAEESASASEEMSAQAEQMKSIVSELTRIVDGGSKSRRLEAGRSKKKGVMPIEKVEVAQPQKPKRPQAKRGALSKPSLLPEKTIPLEDSNFQDF